METQKQKKFVTEYEINEEKYGGEIYATSLSEAMDFVEQRRETERVVGRPYLELKEIDFIVEKVKNSDTFGIRPQSIKDILEEIPFIPDKSKETSNKESQTWEKVDRPIMDYPIGTKFRSSDGGYWERVTLYGFKWHCGSIFPMVGEDWDGMVCFPD